ncbi:RPM1-interacting protein 4 [Senna tora]|uniref:RPM1-interacting protein 4 n=1 Tax=Senna tora TaxID=362788 RepID=A0A834XJD7_9FABA|nr:RPM1-interacting protein 4 [Senna tora]
MRRMVKHYQWCQSMVVKPLSKPFLLSFISVEEPLAFWFSEISTPSDPETIIFSIIILCNFWVYMAQNSHVPKFGNWESEENVPYTAYFDKARKGRTSTKTINPNDPEESPDLAADNVSNRNGSDSTHHHGEHGAVSTDTHRKPARQSTGSENSIERSPLHRQAKTPGRDGHNGEAKNSYDSSHGTPGRSRLKPVNRGDETVYNMQHNTYSLKLIYHPKAVQHLVADGDGDAAVPKFGEWDESDPASADGFTHIFNKVREERQGAKQAPGTPTQRSYITRSQANDDKAQVHKHKQSVKLE